MTVSKIGACDEVARLAAAGTPSACGGQPSGLAFGVEACRNAGAVLGRGDAMQIVAEDWASFIKRNRETFRVREPGRMSKGDIRAWVSERIDAVEHMRRSLQEEIADALSQRVEAFTAKGASLEALNALRVAYIEAADKVVAMVIDPFVATLADIVTPEAS